MSEMKKGYKIVREGLNQIISCWVDNPKLQITYEINKWIKPKLPNTPILLFDDIDNLLKWFNEEFNRERDMATYRYFEVEFKEFNKNQNNLFFTTSGYAKTSLIFGESFGEMSFEPRNILYSDFPKGSLYASEIKLIKDMGILSYFIEEDYDDFDEEDY